MEPLDDWVDRYRRASACEPTPELESRVWARLRGESRHRHALVLRPVHAVAMAVMALGIGVLTSIALTPPAASGIELSVFAVNAPQLPSTVLGQYIRQARSGDEM